MPSPLLRVVCASILFRAPIAGTRGCVAAESTFCASWLLYSGASHDACWMLISFCWRFFLSFFLLDVRIGRDAQCTCTCHVNASGDRDDDFIKKNYKIISHRILCKNNFNLGHESQTPNSIFASPSKWWCEFHLKNEFVAHSKNIRYRMHALAFTVFSFNQFMSAAPLPF